MRLKLSIAAFAATLAVAGQARADEGMWTFDAFPLARANAALGTSIDQSWLDRVRLGAVNLGGCSASLVSPQGLILTNQHCIRTCVQANASPGQDLLSQGVFARARDEELRCPGQTAQVLLSIEDVTARVNAATADKTGAQFAQARDAETSAIEQAGCGTDQAFRCQVVSLYAGGQYNLYRYRRYSDVRLVYAPEHQAVIFGGDPDNFNFPRFALDAAFLRAYENDQPAATPNHLRWNPAPIQDGQPVFVAGNPGSTQRLTTLAELRAERDLTLPATIKRLSELRGRLIFFAGLSEENARMTRDALRGTENNLKRSYGMHRSLADLDFWGRLEAGEAGFRQAAVARDPSIASAFDDVASAQAEAARLMDRYSALESTAGGGSVLYGYARGLVRAAAEREKPPAERLPGYSDASLATLGRTLAQERNIDEPLEALYLQFWLNKTREALGTDAPVVKAMLGRESPEALGARLIEGTTLGDPAVRTALFTGGMAAIRASTDPMIQFVLANDPAAREVLGEWR
ncbi:MAG TPA: S46 family peptidase, partial [Caulobacteraceae bacterium]